jgi:hypothetical protein
MPRGTIGVTAGVAVFICLLVGKGISLEDARFQFAKDFDKQLQVYLDITKFILTMAGGGIVLVVSATIFRSSGERTSLPQQYASPLAILALTILYGVLFMACLARDYEKSKRSTDLYTRWPYAKNQALGYSAIIWLLFRIRVACRRRR